MGKFHPNVVTVEELSELTDKQLQDRLDELSAMEDVYLARMETHNVAAEALRRLTLRTASLVHGITLTAAATRTATDDLIDRFAAVLREKANAAERKYGWGDGWMDPDAVDGMRDDLYRHLAKGDPRDVAIYAAFLWHHAASTALTAAATEEAGDGE